MQVWGTVQGVGFRPFVYRLATRHGLGGWVLNHSAGVELEIEGRPGALDAFLHDLQAEAPPLARLEAVAVADVPSVGSASFEILSSHIQPGESQPVPADTAPCSDCLRELFDPSDRRYHYPFINCTNCGPRFTLIQDVPYDRERTTMAVFRMCPDCQREYDDPSDRRFHAQPNACPRCGPRLRLLDRAGQEIDGADPIVRAAQLLQEGAILAVKGLGGYHLACNAFDAQAVERLRRRKHREDKPFALMAPDLEAVDRLCCVTEAEAELLASERRPIVLLRRREPSPVAPEVAPGHRLLGLMLPYTPLHSLLLEAARSVLVMTSGNRSEEPIAYQDEDALHRLGPLADAFLVHDRAIHTRCDDSVTRVLGGQELLLRRSRGYAPRPIALRVPFAEPVLACGAELKNTFCLGKGRHALVSHHIGDLENWETLASFAEGIERFARLFDVHPTVVAYDLHPEYLSTKYALELPGVARVGVQHHHAHIASCMAEHGLEGPAIGVAFDGLGYGLDGTLWGGEFLVADYLDCTRVAHLAPMPLPGGAQAIRQPWRMAATYLHAAYGDEMEALGLDFMRRLDRGRWAVLKQMLRKGINSPPTSSLGRLFDAVAALVGVRDVANYEGQAAVELEVLADEACQERYPYTIDDGSRPLVLRVEATIRGVVDDLLNGTEPACVAAKFHNTLAEAVAALCGSIRAEHGLDRVVLGGGVFQNAFLLGRVVPRLAALDFQVYVPSQVPPNDGGIALGQAVIANARVRAGKVGKEAGPCVSAS
ncbi:MAG: carbamoyltransferase HypF [Chloroflexi bacterium]|nr:carbamoyltransferase HypF [Chloroflexota bacterium]